MGSGHAAVTHKKILQLERNNCPVGAENKGNNVSILMNLARDLSDYFQFFGRKLHIVIFLALSKAFSAGLKAFP